MEDSLECLLLEVGTVTDVVLVATVLMIALGVVIDFVICCIVWLSYFRWTGQGALLVVFLFSYFSFGLFQNCERRC